MQAHGVVERYAIGGAVGATFYLEPGLDTGHCYFIELHAAPAALLVTLEPIFLHLRDRGYTMEGEHIVISGWPVQFLPPTAPLGRGSLGQRDRDGRGGNSRARLLQFIEAGALDSSRFEQIITRHNLVDRWHQFQRQFLSDD